MATDNFEHCLSLTLAFEGGYSDDRRDPGGATNFGITRAVLAKVRGRPVAKSEVAALSRTEAAAIYRRLYWNVVAGDALPAGMDAMVFDYAVNSGPARAIAALQAVLKRPFQPAIDNELLAAAAAASSRQIIVLLGNQRLSFLNRLKTFSFFGKGWTRRVAAIGKASLAMAAPASTSPPASQLPSPSQPPLPNLKGTPMTTSANTTLEAVKPFWASQTIWSAAAVIGSSAAGALLAWQNGDINAFGTSMTAVFGGIYAIVGRVRATGAIG